jgi:hypothetical protein
MMFTPEERDRVERQVLDWAHADSRVVAGAIVGSRAHHPGDRFSDLDLTFGIAAGCPISEVLDDWSQRLVEQYRAVHLFDLPSGAALYRVFLLPGCLQLDLSFAPAAAFGAIGPQFRLLFGNAIEQAPPAAPDVRQLFGYGVHHAVRARICVERQRYWHAEYWISGVRDYALTMACVRLGLPAHFGRGFDGLPDALRTAAASALVRSLERGDLLSALRCATDLLLSEAAAASVAPPGLVQDLQEVVANG